MDNRVRDTRLSDNGGIDDQTPAPRTFRRLSDALTRLQIRARNNPRHAGRVAGAAFALLLFLGLALGFLLALDDQPLYLRLTLAFLGATLGGALFTVVLVALASRTVGGRLIPAETAPGDVRAARRALRAGRLSGSPEVDRIARVLASRALRQRVPPWAVALLGPFIGGMNLFQAWVQYDAHGGWHRMAVTALVLGVLMLVGTVMVVPLAGRSTRRTRAFAEAHDAGRRRPTGEGPE